MSTAEGDTGRGDLRERIVEAARDIVSEQGLEALSMRALALRIDHSPGTIYLHFRDKDELLRSVRVEGFRRLGEGVRGEMVKAGPEASYLERYAATGRGYARFAVEQTGYFKTMFQVPGVAALESCHDLPPRVAPEEYEESRAHGVMLLRKAAEAGEVVVDDPERAWFLGWGLVHGLTSLYVTGHLRDVASDHEEFMELIENAIRTLGAGWRRERPPAAGGEAEP